MERIQWVSEAEEYLNNHGFNVNEISDDGGKLVWRVIWRNGMSELMNTKNLIDLANILKFPVRDWTVD